jgi:hypothetical protein
MLVDEKIRDDI